MRGYFSCWEVKYSKFFDEIISWCAYICLKKWLKFYQSLSKLSNYQLLSGHFFDSFISIWQILHHSFLLIFKLPRFFIKHYWSNSHLNSDQQKKSDIQPNSSFPLILLFPCLISCIQTQQNHFQDLLVLRKHKIFWKNLVPLKNEFKKPQKILFFAHLVCIECVSLFFQESKFRIFFLAQ